VAVVTNEFKRQLILLGPQQCLQQIFFLAFDHPIANYTDISLLKFLFFVKTLDHFKKVCQCDPLGVLTAPWTQVVFIKGPHPV